MSDWFGALVILVAAVGFIAAVATGLIRFPDEHDYR